MQKKSSLPPGAVAPDMRFLRYCMQGKSYSKTNQFPIQLVLAFLGTLCEKKQILKSEADVARLLQVELEEIKKLGLPFAKSGEEKETEKEKSQDCEQRAKGKYYSTNINWRDPWRTDTKKAIMDFMKKVPEADLKLLTIPCPPRGASTSTSTSTSATSASTSASTLSATDSTLSWQDMPVSEFPKIWAAREMRKDQEKEKDKDKDKRFISFEDLSYSKYDPSPAAASPLRSGRNTFLSRFQLAFQGVAPQISSLIHCTYLNLVGLTVTPSLPQSFKFGSTGERRILKRVSGKDKQEAEESKEAQKRQISLNELLDLIKLKFGIRRNKSNCRVFDIRTADAFKCSFSSLGLELDKSKFFELFSRFNVISFEACSFPEALLTYVGEQIIAMARLPYMLSIDLSRSNISLEILHELLVEAEDWELVLIPSSAPRIDGRLLPRRGSTRGMNEGRQLVAPLLPTRSYHAFADWIASETQPFRRSTRDLEKSFDRDPEPKAKFLFVTLAACTYWGYRVWSFPALASVLEKESQSRELAQIIVDTSKAQKSKKKTVILIWFLCNVRLQERRRWKWLIGAFWSFLDGELKSLESEVRHNTKFVLVGLPKWVKDDAFGPYLPDLVFDEIENPVTSSYCGKIHRAYQEITGVQSRITNKFFDNIISFTTNRIWHAQKDNDGNWLSSRTEILGEATRNADGSECWKWFSITNNYREESGKYHKTNEKKYQESLPVCKYPVVPARQIKRSRRKRSKRKSRGSGAEESDDDDEAAYREPYLTLEERPDGGGFSSEVKIDDSTQRKESTHEWQRGDEKHKERKVPDKPKKKPKKKAKKQESREELLASLPAMSTPTGVGAGVEVKVEVAVGVPKIGPNSSSNTRGDESQKPMSSPKPNPNPKPKSRAPVELPPLPEHDEFQKLHDFLFQPTLFKTFTSAKSLLPEAFMLLHFLARQFGVTLRCFNYEPFSKLKISLSRFISGLTRVDKWGCNPNLGKRDIVALWGANQGTLSPEEAKEMATDFEKANSFLRELHGDALGSTMALVFLDFHPSRSIEAGFSPDACFELLKAHQEACTAALRPTLKIQPESFWLSLMTSFNWETEISHIGAPLHLVIPKADRAPEVEVPVCVPPNEACLDLKHQASPTTQVSLPESASPAPKLALDPAAAAPSGGDAKQNRGEELPPSTTPESLKSTPPAAKEKEPTLPHLPDAEFQKMVTFLKTPVMYKLFEGNHAQDSAIPILFHFLTKRAGVHIRLLDVPHQAVTEALTPVFSKLKQPEQEVGERTWTNLALRISGPLDLETAGAQVRSAMEKIYGNSNPSKMSVLFLDSPQGYVIEPEFRDWMRKISPSPCLDWLWHNRGEVNAYIETWNSKASGEEKLALLPDLAQDTPAVQSPPELSRFCAVEDKSVGEKEKEKEKTETQSSSPHAHTSGVEPAKETVNLPQPLKPTLPEALPAPSQGETPENKQGADLKSNIRVETKKPPPEAPRESNKRPAKVKPKPLPTNKLEVQPKRQNVGEKRKAVAQSKRPQTKPSSQPKNPSKPQLKPIPKSKPQLKATPKVNPKVTPKSTKSQKPNHRVTQPGKTPDQKQCQSKAPEVSATKTEPSDSTHAGRVDLNMVTETKVSPAISEQPVQTPLTQEPSAQLSKDGPTLPLGESGEGKRQASDSVPALVSPDAKTSKEGAETSAAQTQPISLPDALQTTLGESNPTVGLTEESKVVKPENPLKPENHPEIAASLPPDVPCDQQGSDQTATQSVEEKEMTPARSQPFLVEENSPLPCAEAIATQEATVETQSNLPAESPPDFLGSHQVLEANDAAKQKPCSSLGERKPPKPKRKSKEKPKLPPQKRKRFKQPKLILPSQLEQKVTANLTSTPPAIALARPVGEGEAHHELVEIEKCRQDTPTVDTLSPEIPRETEQSQRDQQRVQLPLSTWKTRPQTVPDNPITTVLTVTELAAPPLMAKKQDLAMPISTKEADWKKDFTHAALYMQMQNQMKTKGMSEIQVEQDLFEEPLKAHPRAAWAELLNNVVNGVVESVSTHRKNSPQETKTLGDYQVKFDPPDYLMLLWKMQLVAAFNLLNNGMKEIMEVQKTGFLDQRAGFMRLEKLRQEDKAENKARYEGLAQDVSSLMVQVAQIASMIKQQATSSGTPQHASSLPEITHQGVKPNPTQKCRKRKARPTMNSAEEVARAIDSMIKKEGIQGSLFYEHTKKRLRFRNKAGKKRSLLCSEELYELWKSKNK